MLNLRFNAVGVAKALGSRSNILAMTYKRFEDLPVWQAAVKFLINLYEFSDQVEGLLRRRSDLRSQFERAALSISNNIAEGFERGSTSELINFLYIARGSAGEVRRCFA